MKKSNIWTLVSLILMIAAVILFMTLRREEPAKADDSADVEWAWSSDAVYSPSSGEVTGEAARYEKAFRQRQGYKQPGYQLSEHSNSKARGRKATILH